MIKITDSNYQQYKKIFSVIWEFIFSAHSSFFNSEFSPVKVLDKWEKESITKAKRALKAGLQDFFSQILIDMPVAQRPLLNQKLLSEGLPGLNELLSVINDLPAKVIKRGKIKNIDEWYAIKEFLDDVESGIPGKQIAELSRLFHEFEAKTDGKK